MARVTSLGAAAPGTSTAPITRSASAIICGKGGAARKARLGAALEVAVEPFQHGGIAIEDRHVRAHADRHLRRVEADHAAADHHDPPGSTPGTPPSSTPRPPCAFSSAVAPAWIAMRPATWLIGFSSGSELPGPVTVS
jgi:hypothetical protein